MHKALLPLLASAAIFLAGTCVTSFEDQWPTGPWTGEFQNNNDYDATFFELQSTVTDSTGADAGAVEGWVCPALVPAGGSAAFEFKLAEEVSVLTPPLTATAPEIGAFTDRLSSAPEGLTVRTLSSSKNARTATLEVRNETTDRIFNSGTVCAVARSAGNKVASVSREVPFPDLGPGETARIEVTFSSPGVTVEPFVQGIEVVLQQANPDGSNVIDTGPFDVTLPPGWDYSPRQGIDSFVGEFNGKGVKIFFDYGWYSGSLDAYENDAAFKVTHETIDGHAAVVVTPRDSQSGFTAARITTEDHDTPDTSVQTTILLQADDVPASVRSEVLTIYRSLRFESE